MFLWLINHKFFYSGSTQTHIMLNCLIRQQLSIKIKSTLGFFRHFKNKIIENICRLTSYLIHTFFKWDIKSSDANIIAQKWVPVWDSGDFIHWILGVANTKKCVLNVCEIFLNLQKKFLKLLISTVYIPTLRPPGEFISPK